MRVMAALIAPIAHEFNRALQIENGEDMIAPAWADLVGSEFEWQIDESIASVERILRGIDPRAEHEAWMERKIADGWVYGPVKDSVAKTHPQIIDYDDLDIFQKAKDRVRIAVVRSLASLPVGY